MPSMILVPTDFSQVTECAAMHAATIAQKSGEEVCLFHVIDKTTKEDLKKKKEDEQYLETKLKRLSELIASRYNVTCSYKLKEGSIFNTIGEVAEETRGARHLLEKIGFTYKNEVDPFDGGPHYGCKLKDVSVIKKGTTVKAVEGNKKLMQEALLGYVEDGEFFCAQTFVSLEKDSVSVNLVGNAYLKQFLGKNVFCSLL